MLLLYEADNSAIILGAGLYFLYRAFILEKSIQSFIVEIIVGQILYVHTVSPLSLGLHYLLIRLLVLGMSVFLGTILVSIIKLRMF